MAEAYGRDLTLRGCAVVVAGSAAGALAAYLVAAGGGAPITIALVAVLVSIAVGGAFAAILFSPLPRLLDSLSGALLSYRDDDYTVRLTDVPALRSLVARFNQLGQRLRQDRNTLYQKELLLETLLEAATFAVVLCDEPCTVVYANGAARSCFQL